MDEAELEGCEAAFLGLEGRRTAPDRWLLIDAADCCETDRSRCTATADSESISSCQTTS